MIGWDRRPETRKNLHSQTTFEPTAAALGVSIGLDDLVVAVIIGESEEAWHILRNRLLDNGVF